MNATRVNDSEFRVQNCAVLRLRSRKLTFVFFLEIRRLLGGTKYIRFIIYLKAINEQKMKEFDFSLSAPASAVLIKISIDF